VLRRRDSAFGIATGYGLDDGGVGVQVLIGSRIFSFPRPDGFRVRPAPCLKGTGGSFRGFKLPDREADHSPRASAKATKTYTYTSSPPRNFRA
jgi:hypothetical protein